MAEAAKRLKARTAGFTAVALVIGLIVLALVGTQMSFSRNTSNPVPVQTSNSSSAKNTTSLEAIIAGTFPSARDKQGTGGVTVTVNNLSVLYVQTESDGDWHVAVTDGKVPVFITEIIPSNQAALGMPVPGTVIDETGVPFCDTFHQFESWHGNTCWEIHPVLSWHPAGTAATYSTQTIGHNVNVNTLFGQNPIPRGSYQTISTSVSDSDGPVTNTAVNIEVDYASGYTTRYFSCVTSASGSCDIGWTIGSTADPGTFTVITTVGSQQFTSSFAVT